MLGRNTENVRMFDVGMSAIGPKQTWAIALHMSAFGGKADMPQRPSLSDDALRGGLERARQLPGNTLHGAGADTDFAGDLQDALTGS